MPIEQYTESLTLREMKCVLGENSFGYVFPQGDVSPIEKIQKLLKKTGGKPKECELNDYSKGGAGKAKPEYIITFNDDVHTIIVVECKNSSKKHQSEFLNKPNGFAVDGALYYAKFLKEEYNVIAVAISGTTTDNMKVDTYYWLKGQESYTLLTKARDIILEPKNYIELIKGNKLQKAYSLDEIRNTAIDMHNFLREIKVTEAHKPIFIAGILIALNDDDFSKTYSSLASYNSVMQNIQIAIENVLKDSHIKNSRISYIKQAFKTLQENTKFSEIPLGHSRSITWYIEQLEMKIKPMMDYADSTVDALGVFYHEFIKYSGGDGSGLGIVLTSQHLTEFMCDLAGVNKKSKVVDICCGSGSFLVTAMSKMFKDANPTDVEAIRKDGLYGVEFDDGLYTLAIANMIIRKDGKSNIYKGDCFNGEITKELKGKKINIGLINPPYSQKDVVELEFVEHLLDILIPSGTGVVVVPMSCAIGTKFKGIRERLFKKNTLKAVFSMPDDIFYPTGTNVCVMVWEAHTPHDSTQETFFGYCKDDGFVKRKKLGRVDAYNRWGEIEKEWLSLYRNRDVLDGLSARHCIKHNDEWLCEAYMKTDYTKLTEDDFQQTVNDYLAYLVKSGEVYENN
ncbi:MAG: N-6 DNA methylase [Oscillospiraceae bacterium]